MKRSGRAVRLSIFVREDDIWHHKPVHVEIVHRAHRAGLAGATVVRGIEGYGVTTRIHTTHLFRLGEDAPVVITIADAEERIRGFLPVIEELVTSGVLVLDEVELVHYETGERRRRRQRG